MFVLVRINISVTFTFRMMGRTAILELAQKQERASGDPIKFPTLERPLYCHALSGQVICFEGYKKNKNEDVEKLVSI